MRSIIISVSLLAAFLGETHAAQPEQLDYYHKVGDWKKVVEVFNANEAAIPTVDGLNKAAEAYYNLGRLKDAERLAEKALLLSNNLDSQILLRLIMARRGDRDGAIRELEALKKGNKEDHAIYTAIGIIESLRDPARAVGSFQKGVDLNDDDFRAWFNLGLIYEDEESFEMATKAYKNAVRINPLFAQAQNNLGYSYKERHFYAYAVEHYLKAIELRPDNPGYYYNVGNAYSHQEKIDLAFDAYKKALELDPKFAKAHYNMARTFLRKDMVSEAIEEFRLYIKYGNEAVFDYVAPRRAVEKEIEELETFLLGDRRFRAARKEMAR